MKKVLYILSAMLLLASCSKDDIKYRENVMDIPIRAENFNDLIEKMNLVCTSVNTTVCGYIKGSVLIHLPELSNNNGIIDNENQETANMLFEKLNNKTPNQMIEEYKKSLKEKLKNDMKENELIKKELKNIENEYEKTRKYAQDIVISDISTVIGKDNIIQINFVLENNTPFNISQFACETEFFTGGTTFLTRSKSFIKDLKPVLASKRKTKVSIIINSIPENDIILVRAAKDLTTKVIITNLTAIDKDKKYKNIILSLPYSYTQLVKMIQEKEMAYKATLKKIDNMY